MKQLNPANAVGAAERKRIPMNVPVQKLEVPGIPGYHLHWFTGTPDRIQRALDAGYEFVDERETRVNSVGLGNESAQSGNTSLDTRVSVVGGSDIGHDGQPVRLILMKIKNEWHEEDLKLVDDRNSQVANALLGGLVGAEKDSAGDTRQRYVDKARTTIPDMFKRKS